MVSEEAAVHWFNRKSDWSWDGMRSRAVARILEQRAFDPAGVEAFPPFLSVVFLVHTGPTATVQRFASDPGFGRDVRQTLLNRLTRASAADLPTLEFQVVTADRDGVEIDLSPQALPDELYLHASANGGPYPWDAASFALPIDRTTFTLGRGPWHGRSNQQGNDLQLPTEARFVSRRAAYLERSGSRLLVFAQDQEDRLRVTWRGRTIRPARVASGRAEIGMEGRIEVLGDEGDEVLVLEVLGAVPHTVRR
jgi:hypothetical protein